MSDKNVKMVPRLRRFVHTAPRYLLCMFILLPGLLLSCAGTGELVKADLGQKVTLRIGQTAQIESEQLSIRFNGISGDSRCPGGVTCVWAGEVNCDVTVTYKGSSADITLTQSGLTEPPAEETYQEYRLIFSVEPYPEAGKQISPADYRLILTVNKLLQSPD
jgi:hypothetical protein